MKLLVLVKGPASIARYLATVGEATEVVRGVGTRRRFSLECVYPRGR